QIVLAIVIVEIIGVLILGTYFLRYFNDVSEAYFNGFFMTITALSNQGFSLDDHSLAMYHHDYFIQTIVMCLIIFGSIGFPFLLEFKYFIFKCMKGKFIFV